MVAQQVVSGLVSIVVPTRNSEAHLRNCLESLRAQTYNSIEIIVIDNFSSDQTLEIAHKMADFVFLAGPERSAQVNFGLMKSHGEYVFRVDSDFILDKEVVSQCVQKAHLGFAAVVVHNTPCAEISRLAALRKFEVDLYKYDLTHSAARFVRKDAYLRLGGYNPSITAGEDYDFQNRLTKAGISTGFIDAEATHMGEPIDLLRLLQKYYFYGRDFVHFVAQNPDRAPSQLGPFRLVYFKKWKVLARHPILGAELFFYHILRFVAAGAGYLRVRLARNS
jgi:glycosyltransferase involved in cell wall biosynthesis